LLDVRGIDAAPASGPFRWCARCLLSASTKGLLMVRFGFVSTYPPTLCGLATFTSALAAELVPTGQRQVVRLVESAQPVLTRDAVHQLQAGDPTGPVVAAAVLAGTDVVILQHEYGVYGGKDGDEVLALLRALTVPTIVVLHTVLTSPTPNQRRVLEEVAALADALVTMTGTARERLADGYHVDMAKVSVIPHGAPTPLPVLAPSFRTGRSTVLTWGLIGPGKGIEWGIEAMSMLPGLVHLDPAPQYLVAGQTHPKVLQHEGDVYRERLQRRVDELGVGDAVTFDSRYRSAIELAQLVDSADIVLLPYDSTEQVTSGVLIEAVAALKPVIATRFPHAVELLSGGAGMLVPHRDPAAIAEALGTLLTHRELGRDMTAAATASAADLLWPAVAARYRDIAERLVAARLAA
jgi:glycosyltransferase involved in cell wall biosynthesis